MAVEYPVPSREAFASALETLLSLKVAAQGLPLEKSYPMPAYVSVYERDSRGIIAFMVADLPLVRATGAAMSMLPKDTAEPRPGDPWADKILVDNFREIMNISAQFFNEKGHEHVRFVNGFPHNKLPGMASTLLELGEVKAVYELSVGDYGTGRLYVVFPSAHMRANPPSIQPLARRSTQVKAA